MVIKKKTEKRKQKIKQKQNWKQTKTEIETENLIETKTNGNDINVRHVCTAYFFLSNFPSSGDAGKTMALKGRKKKKEKRKKKKEKRKKK